MLEEFAADVFVAAAPVRFAGIEMGTRMAVLRTGAGLLVHSPIAPGGGLAEAVAALGPVRWIVAPNRFHHLWAGEFAAAFPEAELFLAPGLAAKRPDLAFPPPRWAPHRARGPTRSCTTSSSRARSPRSPFSTGLRARWW